MFGPMVKYFQEKLPPLKRVAVLGRDDIFPKSMAQGVSAASKRAGLDVVPVPVYYPDVTEILGKKVYRKVEEIPEPVDMVNVFRRPGDIPPHIDDIIAAKPKSVWFQLGIRNDEAARRLAEAGIKVVQDRCLMVEQGMV